MKAYTLHLPPGRWSGDARAIEAARIVPDGFSWGAFLFTFLWCFRHRLLLAGILVLLAFAALGIATYGLNLRPGLAALAAGLLAFLVGLEGSSLRRWTYERRGRPVADVLVAKDADEAEAKFLTRALVATPSRTAAPAQGAYARSPEEGIFGLFPKAEGPW